MTPEQETTLRAELSTLKAMIASYDARKHQDELYADRKDKYDRDEMEADRRRVHYIRTQLFKPANQFFKPIPYEQTWEYTKKHIQAHFGPRDGCCPVCGKF